MLHFSNLTPGPKQAAPNPLKHRQELDATQISAIFCVPRCDFFPASCQKPPTADPSFPLLFYQTIFIFHFTKEELRFVK